MTTTTKFTTEPCTCQECQGRRNDLAMDEEKDLGDGGLGSGRWILDEYTQISRWL